MVCTMCSDARSVHPFCHCCRRMVYLGPSRLALSYFETIGFAVPPNENPAGERAPYLPSGPPNACGPVLLCVCLYGEGTCPALCIRPQPASPHNLLSCCSSPRLCHGRDCRLGATCRWRPLPARRPGHPLAVPRPQLGAAALQAGGQGCGRQGCCAVGLHRALGSGP